MAQHLERSRWLERGRARCRTGTGNRTGASCGGDRPRRSVGTLRREHEDAVEELRAALDLNPNFALGHACFGLALAYGGKGAQAVVHLETAMRLSPRDPFFSVFVSMRSFAHFMAGDYAAGLDCGRRAVRLSPEISAHWRSLALSAAMLCYLKEAHEALAKARQLQPDYSVAWVERASPLVQAADRARYCHILREVGLPEQ